MSTRDSDGDAVLVGLAWLIAGLGALLLFVVLSLTFGSVWGYWARGHAISAWVKAKHRVDIPWYEAGYLPIDASDFSVEVKADEHR